MTTADLHHHLQSLMAERALALIEGLGSVPSYLAAVDAEIAVTRARGGRVFTVRAERGVVHPLLGPVQYADLITGRYEARARLLAGLR